MFKNKFAVVTGASTGIGRAIAIELGSKGANVAIIARNITGLENTKLQIIEKGGKADIFPCDLRKIDQITETVAKVLDKYNTVDFIINCAGVWHNDEVYYAGKYLHETPIEQIPEIFEVTIIAPMILTRAFLPIMINKKSGKIIQISGTFENGAKGWVHYYVAKKAIEHFTEGLSQEMRKYEIQVNTISPSDTLSEAYDRFFGADYETDQAKNDFCNTPEDIAKKVVFLLSEDADNITGQCLIVRNKKAN